MTRDLKHYSFGWNPEDFEDFFQDLSRKGWLEQFRLKIQKNHSAFFVFETHEKYVCNSLTKLRKVHLEKK